MHWKNGSGSLNINCGKCFFHLLDSPCSEQSRSYSSFCHFSTSSHVQVHRLELMQLMNFWAWWNPIDKAQRHNIKPTVCLALFHLLKVFLHRVILPIPYHIFLESSILCFHQKAMCKIARRPTFKDSYRRLGTFKR